MEKSLHSLRKRNKTALVESAFRIYQPLLEHQLQQRDYWIRKLVDGYDFREFINHLKHGIPIPDSIDIQAASKNDLFGRVQLIDENREFHADLKQKLWVRVENYSCKIIQSTPEEPVFASYHWYRQNGDVYQFDGVRTPLPHPIPPGQQIEMAVNVIPPSEPGSYKLMVTMVHDGRYWMEEVGLEVHLFDCVVHDYDGRGLTRHATSVFEQLVEALSHNSTRGEDAHRH